MVDLPEPLGEDLPLPLLLSFETHAGHEWGEVATRKPFPLEFQRVREWRHRGPLFIVKKPSNLSPKDLIGHLYFGNIWGA